MGQGVSDFFSFLMKNENFIKFHAYFMPISGLKFRLWRGFAGGLGLFRETSQTPIMRPAQKAGAYVVTRLAIFQMW